MVRVDGDGVDVVGMCVRVDFTGYSRNNVVLLSHNRQLELRLMGRRWYGAFVFREVGL